MKPRQIRLSTTPAAKDLETLCLGDIVYLDGLIYTAREGVYMRALRDKANIPMELPSQSAANFHCSPAALVEREIKKNLARISNSNPTLLNLIQITMDCFLRLMFQVKLI